MARRRRDRQARKQERAARTEAKVAKAVAVPGLTVVVAGLSLFTLVVPFLYFDALADASSIPRWTLLEFGAPALCAWVFYCWWQRGRKSELVIPLLFFPGAILLGTALLTCTWAIDRHEAINWTYHHIAMVFLGGLAAYATYHRPRDLPYRLAQLAVIACVGESLIGLTQYFGGLKDVFFQNEIPAATMVHRNAFAQYLDSIIAPAVLLVFAATTWKRMLFWGTACVLIVASLIATT
ncbi:hypothetical protein ACFL59_13865, partial [Planctomycetota bacterium]